MPWSLEWSMAIIGACLALHSFWLSRETKRMRRSVDALEMVSDALQHIRASVDDMIASTAAAIEENETAMAKSGEMLNRVAAKLS